MALTDELERVAHAAAALADGDERVEAVLAAEPSPGARYYLCAFARGDGRTWLVLDEASQPVTARHAVRQAASIAALAEIAADTAGGGDLGTLRGELDALRRHENPPGIDEAEAAAIDLEQAVGTPPRLATPAYLDDVGEATRRLERALGEDESAFARALAAARDAVDALTAEVEANYKRNLT